MIPDPQKWPTARIAWIGGVVLILIMVMGFTECITQSSVCTKDLCWRLWLHCTWTTINSPAVLGLVAIVVSVIGIWAWQVQLRGTSKHQVARRVLKALYSLQDEILVGRRFLEAATKIRYALYTGKMSVIDVKAGEPDSTARLFMQKMEAADAELVQAGLEARVIWGDEARTRLDPVFREYMLVELNYAMQWETNPGLPPPEPPKKASALYPGEGEDVFARRLREAVAEAAEFFQAQL